MGPPPRYKHVITSLLHCVYGSEGEDDVLMLHRDDDALLSCPPSSFCRSLEEAAVVTTDTVVCGFLTTNMEWSLCVWRGWGSQELDVFYKSYEELARLEADMRKRR